MNDEAIMHQAKPGRDKGFSTLFIENAKQFDSHLDAGKENKF